MNPVTRVEIADTIRDAFTNQDVERGDLIATAAANRARPEVLQLINQLPERRYRALTDLWEHIGHVPVDV
ncbi:MAG: DUF2795 domain-containing protein [Acidimicrobiia bacterium]